MDEAFMQEAIEKARKGVAAGQSPFGACVQKDGRVIACAHNLVLHCSDPTAHAEVLAIRTACRVLGTIDLSGCVIYSTCEPCPMCFSACHWAKLDRIVYGARIEDAASYGFSELSIPNEEMKRLGGSPIEITPDVLRAECLALFAEWAARPDHQAY